METPGERPVEHDLWLKAVHSYQHAVRSQTLIQQLLLAHQEPGMGLDSGYLIANAFGGEATPPRVLSGAEVKKHA